MSIKLKDNKVYMTECTIKDITTSIKALQLLNQTVINIEVRAWFDFDTKYYYRFDEDKINKMYQECNNHSIENVILKNNRLYYKDMLLPNVDKFEWVMIYCKENE